MGIEDQDVGMRAYAEEYALARRVANSSGDDGYATKEAEDKDLAYIVGNSCISCNKPFLGEAVRVMPPRYIQERDYYVIRGVVPRRYMCLHCYGEIKSKARERFRNNLNNRARRKAVLKHVMQSIMLR